MLQMSSRHDDSTVSSATEVGPSMSTPQTAPARGRPRTFDVDVVLQAALELFWKRGYQATTTRELEAALGLSQSSLYNAFGSKQALLTAALDRYETLIDAELLSPLESSPAGLDAVDAFLVALGEWVAHDGRRGCMLINMMAEDGGETASLRERTRRYRARVRSAIVRALERGATRGEIAGEDIDVRADLLIGMILGLNIAARGGVSTDEIARLLASVRHQVQHWRISG